MMLLLLLHEADVSAHQVLVWTVGKRRVHELQIDGLLRRGDAERVFVGDGRHREVTLRPAASLSHN